MSYFFKISLIKKLHKVQFTVILSKLQSPTWWLDITLIKEITVMCINYVVKGEKVFMFEMTAADVAGLGTRCGLCSSWDARQKSLPAMRLIRILSWMREQTSDRWKCNDWYSATQLRLLMHLQSQQHMNIHWATVSTALSVICSCTSLG